MYVIDEGNSVDVKKEWLLKVEMFGYEEFADLRYISKYLLCGSSNWVWCMLIFFCIQGYLNYLTYWWNILTLNLPCVILSSA